jgi:hypothetical protein
MMLFTLGVVLAVAATEPAPVKFTGGSPAAFQTLLDQSPIGAVIICAQTQPLIVTNSLLLRKPVTVRNLKASLAPAVGRTPLLAAAPIELRNIHQVVIRNASVTAPAGNIPAVTDIACAGVQLERVTSNGTPVETPVAVPYNAKTKKK